MKFLWIDKISEEKAKVAGVHYQPDQLSEETLAKGIIVDEVIALPLEVPIGKSAVRYINPQTKEQWVEYVDRELTEDEKMRQKIELLEGSVMELTTALAMVAGGVE